MDCKKFTDFLIRKAEHLDNTLIRSLDPIDTWVGTSRTGRFSAEDGVEHTFDRLEKVFPDLRGKWRDVTAQSCVGNPCDPDTKKIGMGYTRDSYRLQETAYATDLVCFNQVMSADRATQQWAFAVENLRRATSIIVSHRLRTESLRIAKFKWATASNTLVPITAEWDEDMVYLTVSTLPTSKLSARHLMRRVQPQIRVGAMGATLNKSRQPMLEYVTAMDEIWWLIEGNPELADHYRFTDFGSAAQDFYKYGWTGKVGNYGLRDDTFQLRFNIVQQNADGTWKLQVVFPYTNVAATEGIKEQSNDDYDNAPIKIDFIHHRDAMVSMVRDTKSINPMMPFASTDFGGKWMFAMDNLTCVQEDGSLGPVDNSWRNKGRFQAWFSFATKAERPEFEEGFLTLREPACVVDIPRCSADPGYPAQNYDSANALCPTTEVVLTDTPILGPDGTYEILSNTVQCSGIPVLHGAVTGTATLVALVAQLNEVLSPLGTWAVDGANITLTGTVCTSFALPWVQT